MEEQQLNQLDGSTEKSLKHNSGTTQLYRHYDCDGRLLYVGISLSAVARLSQHKDSSHWYYQIARIEIETHQTRGEAMAAEALAIAVERPAHNVQAPTVNIADISARMIADKVKQRVSAAKGRPIGRLVLGFQKEMLTDQQAAERYQRYLWTQTLSDTDYLMDQQKWYG